MENRQKVYLVTAGSYSDYRVLAAFSTRYRAKQYMDQHNSTLSNRWYEADIEAYDLDLPNEWGTVITVHMDRSGYVKNLIEQHIHMPASEVGCRLRKDLIENTVLCDDQKRAIKATNELRAQLIANKEWEA